jgi:hypothetical protein
MTIGQRLRAAREAKDLTIGDIARRTNIQPRFLQAIDEDNLGVIPASHQKLFIREYAKLAGLEPEVVLADLPDYTPPPPPPSMPGHVFVDNAVDAEEDSGSDAPPRKPKFDLRRNFPSLPHKRGVKMSGSNASNLLIAAALVLLVIIGVWYFLLRDPRTAGEVGDAIQPGDSTEGSPTEIITRQDGAGDTAAAAVTGAEGDSLTLEGRATAKVWFSILMDGKRSEDGTLDSGMTKTWRAYETFRLSLGNAGGLDLYLNDRPIGTLGPKLSAIRNQIIDANGIRRKGTPPAPPRNAGATAAPAAPTPRPAARVTPRSPRPAPARTPRRVVSPRPRQVTPTDVRPPGTP